MNPYIDHTLSYSLTTRFENKGLVRTAFWEEWKMLAQSYAG